MKLVFINEHPISREPLLLIHPQHPGADTRLVCAILEVFGKAYDELLAELHLLNLQFIDNDEFTRSVNRIMSVFKVRCKYLLKSVMDKDLLEASFKDDYLTQQIYHLYLRQPTFRGERISVVK